MLSTTDLVWSMAIAIVGGLAFGGFYFGALWWTICHLRKTRHPYLFLVGSFLIRLSFVGIAFYLLIGDRWERIFPGLLGFIVMRTILVRHLSKPQLISVSKSYR